MVLNKTIAQIWINIAQIRHKWEWNNDSQNVLWYPEILLFGLHGYYYFWTDILIETPNIKHEKTTNSSLILNANLNYSCSKHPIWDYL